MRVVVTPLISRNPAKEVVEFLSGIPSEELSSCLYFCDIYLEILSNQAEGPEAFS